VVEEVRWEPHRLCRLHFRAERGLEILLSHPVDNPSLLSGFKNRRGTVGTDLAQRAAAEPVDGCVLSERMEALLMVAERQKRFFAPFARILC
jgi:hypothetical protein